MIEPTVAPRVSGPVVSSKPWEPVTHQPEPYDLVLLRFADGSQVRGTWNGRMWWGYDPRVRRAQELHPIAWQAWE